LLHDNGLLVGSRWNTKGPNGAKGPLLGQNLPAPRDMNMGDWDQ